MGTHMSDSPALTATMAKLFADQGYFRKAAEIYRYLVNQAPERQDLREALAAVERHLAQHPAPTRKDVELMLREWVELLQTQNRRRMRGRNRC
jgi:hypothetical protein